jgi:hypothetical protein
MCPSGSVVTAERRAEEKYMVSHRRTNKQRSGLAAQRAAPPARKLGFLLVTAIVLGLGIVGGVVVARLTNREVDVAEDSSKSMQVAPAGADAAETPPPAEVQTAKTAPPSGEAETSHPPDASAKPERTKTVSGATPGFEVLKGKWRRPDGGYVIDIKDIEDSGRMDASYANPRPIKVFKAQASREDAAVKVFIELRDVNYPGSTYNLIYDSQSDQLQGIYYQAAQQQRFEVFFVRTK